MADLFIACGSGRTNCHRPIQNFDSLGHRRFCFIPRLHDPADVQQTFSKCIQNTRANCSTFAGNLLDVCWIVLRWYYWSFKTRPSLLHWY